MQQLDQFKDTFFQECDEQLGVLEGHLAKLTKTASPVEALNAAFRAVHSIKGGAGMFGFSRLVAFAHVVESALADARAGKVTVDRSFVDKILQASDVLGGLATVARTNDILPDDYEDCALAQLESIITDAAPSRPNDGYRTDDAGTEGHATGVPNKPTVFRITFQPAQDILRFGKEPLLLFRNLANLGKLIVTADTENLPSFSDFDPAVTYISWMFELETWATREDILEVFEFYSNNCHLEIEREQDNTIDQKVCSLLAPEGEIDVEEPQHAGLDDRPITSIRVDLERVERLLDLVGEMTIAQAMVTQYFDESIIDSDPQLFNGLTNLLQLSRDLQDGVMAIRAQPVRSIFARMPRVVREAALESGKRIELTMSGDETEIDKTIIEQLADPLMHIVRNAADHGIETEAERRASGKPDVGQIKLFATQRGGRIIVEVTDDGRGIDRETVHQRAIDLELVPPGQPLSDKEIDNLIFSPGLSTATTVSDISGRGVGMDVVNQNIQNLGGRVSVSSEPNQGCTTTITLPITLAVLDAMLVHSASEIYLIPFTNILECIAIEKADVNSVPGTGDFITVRGRQVRILNLARQLGLPATDDSKYLEIVLVELHSGGFVGLIVDEICGHRQVVVKSVSEHFRNIQGIAGASILGDGNVAFILDVDQLVQAPLIGSQNSRNQDGARAA